MNYFFMSLASLYTCFNDAVARVHLLSLSSRPAQSIPGQLLHLGEQLISHLSSLPAKQFSNHWLQVGVKEERLLLARRPPTLDPLPRQLRPNTIEIPSPEPDASLCLSCNQGRCRRHSLWRIDSDETDSAAISLVVSASPWREESNSRKVAFEESFPLECMRHQCHFARIAACVQSEAEERKQYVLI